MVFRKLAPLQIIMSVVTFIHETQHSKEQFPRFGLIR